jgi:hypothetical protein
MIPGNRPEDEAEEKFWEALDTQFKEKYPNWYKEYFETGIYNPTWGLSKNLKPDDFEDAFMAYVIMARHLGYIEGCNDAKMEQDLARMEDWQERKIDERA